MMAVGVQRARQVGAAGMKYRLGAMFAVRVRAPGWIAFVALDVGEAPEHVQPVHCDKRSPHVDGHQIKSWMTTGRYLHRNALQFEGTGYGTGPEVERLVD